jgi:exodeoxyribonuclease VII large subunit
VSADGFFDVYQRVKGKTKNDPPAGTKPMSVTELTRLIDRAVKSGVPASVLVQGEISNTRDRQASGHCYFTLKDAGACINCVMWRDAASQLPFKLQDGVEMIAAGRVTVYAPQGKYQLTVQTLQPVGRGALELAFRQLQAKLAAQGLFAPERKKPIPAYPIRLALVTSRSTAGLADMLKVLRRFPWLKLMLYHVAVQGDGSGEKIADAIAHLNRHAQSVGGVDVILLARGGGSLEDLWAFNQEAVALAAAASKIPIVTGIGHEIDCCIVDLVADYHAHTPTEAAQIVTQHWKKAAEQLGFSHTRLRRAQFAMIQESAGRLAAIVRHEIFRRPLDRLRGLAQLLDDRQRAASVGLLSRLRGAREKFTSLEPRLRLVARGWLAMRTARLDALDGRLQALSPQAVLRRGYTMTTLKKTGQILRAAAALKPGDRLITRFADGEAESVVHDSRQLSLFE